MSETEFDGLVLHHDPDDPGDLRAESVMGISRTTRTLINTTPVRPIESALDLGCGSGLLALLAARRASRVVATDVNERACEITAANAERNGFENVETRVGSLFEPVDGETFDLIASNLPFVVSPDTDYVFRDGQFSGDEITRRSITKAPEHLTPGGIGVFTASWAVRTGETWRDPVAAWIAPLSCDAWVLGGVTQTTDEYVHRWNAPLLADDADRYAATRTRWLDFYAGESIEQLCYGVIIVQSNGSEQRWVRLDAQTTSPTTGGGAQVDRALRNGPRLAVASDDEIRAACFDLVAPHSLDQQLRYSDEGYTSGSTTMTLEETCGVTGSVEPLTNQVLLRLGGATPMDSVVREAADDTGIGIAEIAKSATPDMRRLAETGLVEVR